MFQRMLRWPPSPLAVGLGIIGLFVLGGALFEVPVIGITLIAAAAGGAAGMFALYFWNHLLGRKTTADQLAYAGLIGILVGALGGALAAYFAGFAGGTMTTLAVLSHPLSASGLSAFGGMLGADLGAKAISDGLIVPPQHSDAATPATPSPGSGPPPAPAPPPPSKTSGLAGAFAQLDAR